MSEVKFACPHCSQHIACEGDYAELSIECPSCGGTLVVPRLTAADLAHGGMVVVAPASLSPPRPTQRIPPLDPWTERRWAEHAGLANGETPFLTTLWVTIMCGVFVLTFVLLGHGVDVRTTIASASVGLILAGYVRSRSLRKSRGEALLQGLVFAIVLSVTMPVVFLGVLFVGCAACS